ncbi:MAG: hypothetical protein SLAVMIC_00316 [uncultured marine phage]|uniref:Uncharacterized protein n=1 Tax=uncultured marine phage TaxID=707152 RepID=A0A8D9CBW2_9VIRU|nr:MAG: hypothetical protein SLAVMIC_00316 [uncultured marine phage]
MGECEYGICDICNREAYIDRKYYRYDIKCECHSPNHFVICYHCENCEPTEPTETKISLRQEGKESKVILETDSLKKIKD